MCPNPPRQGRRIKPVRKRYPWLNGGTARAVVVEVGWRIAWPFRLHLHDPSCRWARFARAVVR